MAEKWVEYSTAYGNKRDYNNNNNTRGIKKLKLKKIIIIITAFV